MAQRRPDTSSQEAMRRLVDIYLSDHSLTDLARGAGIGPNPRAGRQTLRNWLIGRADRNGEKYPRSLRPEHVVLVTEFLLRHFGLNHLIPAEKRKVVENHKN